MRLTIEFVLILIIISLASVVVMQQSHIESLEYRSSAFENLLNDFAGDIKHLQTRLTTACTLREPINKSSEINWTRVCGSYYTIEGRSK